MKHSISNQFCRYHLPFIYLLIPITSPVFIHHHKKCLDVEELIVSTGRHRAAPRPHRALLGRRMYGAPGLPHLQYPAAPLGNVVLAQAPIPPPGPALPLVPPAAAAAGLQGQLAARALPFPNLPRVNFYGMFIMPLDHTFQSQY